MNIVQPLSKSPKQEDFDEQQGSGRRHCCLHRAQPGTDYSRRRLAGLGTEPGPGQALPLVGLYPKNCHNPNHEFSDATEPHGTGFLLGKISGLRKSGERGRDRWQIAISEFARINFPYAWDHGRNLVRYTSLPELGITLDGIKFEPMPVTGPTAKTLPAQSPAPATAAAIMAEAKISLAAAFGVKPESVEITIRG